MTWELLYCVISCSTRKWCFHVTHRRVEGTRHARNIRLIVVNQVVFNAYRDLALMTSDRWEVLLMM